MSKEDQKNETPFEKAIADAKKFKENMNLYYSVVLMAETAIALGKTSIDGPEVVNLTEMLDDTITQFSEFIEDRGDAWN